MIFAIPKAFIQELLNRADIVDVIEAAVPLKRAGSNLVACCPFHSEKSPSFTVSPSKQFYHCFGCGAHGSALGFLMEYHGLSFVEAVKDLASRVGMQVPEIAREPRTAPAQAAGPATEDLAQALHEAALFFQAELKRSEHAIAYLKDRPAEAGQTAEVAFSIIRVLESLRQKRGVSREETLEILKTAGLSAYLASLR